MRTRTENGTPLCHYVYTPGGLPLYSLEAADDARHVYHFDEMGSTVFVTDASGAVAGPTPTHLGASS